MNDAAYALKDCVSKLSEQYTKGPWKLDAYGADIYVPPYDYRHEIDTRSLQIIDCEDMMKCNQDIPWEMVVITSSLLIAECAFVIEKIRDKWESSLEHQLPHKVPRAFIDWKWGAKLRHNKEELNIFNTLRWLGVETYLANMKDYNDDIIIFTKSHKLSPTEVLGWYNVYGR